MDQGFCLGFTRLAPALRTDTICALLICFSFAGASSKAHGTKSLGDFG
jgi:hypothetical protein